MIASRCLIRVAAPLVVALAALVVAGCGGGSTGVQPGVFGSPPTPTIPTAAPFSASASAALVASGGQVSVTLPSAGGYTGSAAFAAPASLPAGATINESLSSGALDSSTVPALQNLGREPRALRGAQAGSVVVLFYFKVIVSATVTFPNAPALLFSVPASSIAPGASYYLAAYDPLRASLGWQKGFEGPATVNGTTLTFAAPSPAAPLTLSANVPTYFALYAVNASAATPSPAPSVTLAPTSVSTTVPAGPAASFSVTLGGYTIAGTLPATNPGPTITLTANLGAAPNLAVGGFPSVANIFLSLTASATGPVTNVAGDTTNVTVTLPSTFSTGGVSLYAVGCQPTGCPYNNSAPSAISLGTNGFTVPRVNLPNIGTTPNSILFFTLPASASIATASPATPSPSPPGAPSASASPSPVPSATSTVVTFVASPPAPNGQSVTVGAGGYTSTLNFGGFSGAQSAQVTAAAGTGLPSGLAASTVLSSTYCGQNTCASPTILAYVSLTANATLTATQTNCGNCSYAPPPSTIGIPSSVAATLSGSPVTAYLEECVGSSCSPNPYDVVPVAANGTTITIPNGAFQDITGLTAGVPLTLVLFTVPTPSGTPASAVSGSGTLGGSVGQLQFPAIGALQNGAGSVYGAALTFSPAPATSATITMNGYNSLAAAATALATSIPANPPNAQPSPSGTASPRVLAVWTFAASSSLTIANAPASTLTGFPPPPTGTYYWTYFADVTAGQANGYGGNSPCNGCTIDTPTWQIALPYVGNTWTMSTGAGSNGSGTTLTGGHTYVFEVVNF